MKIYGAGLAGLLAATMLRRYRPVVYEAQSELPNNHNALLRFRSDAVSRATGIPFKKVRVQKGISYKNEIFTQPSLRFSNMYSQKVTREVTSRSIDHLETVDRFIAPPDFIRQLAVDLNFSFSSSLAGVSAYSDPPIISTIPMPALMKIVGWNPSGAFLHKTISTVTCEIIKPVTEVYQTLYYPGPEAFYRASITGSHLIIEYVGDAATLGKDGMHLHILKVLGDFGMQNTSVTNLSLKVNQYGKIAPVPEEARKPFILAMSDQYNVYSVGRYATWRGILLDDVVKDITLVERFIRERDGYTKKLAQHT